MGTVQLPPVVSLWSELSQLSPAGVQTAMYEAERGLIHDQKWLTQPEQTDQWADQFVTVFPQLVRLGALKRLVQENLPSHPRWPNHWHKRELLPLGARIIVHPVSHEYFEVNYVDYLNGTELIRAPFDRVIDQLAKLGWSTTWARLSDGSIWLCVMDNRSPELKTAMANQEWRLIGALSPGAFQYSQIRSAHG